mmetsp:Transcript_115783/g.265839  ORF Transcript_115783/g.265839 Transcript_115783/m.265839 type:complete len:268 (-) Transcript_115783:238-1041(-)
MGLDLFPYKNHAHSHHHRQLELLQPHRNTASHTQAQSVPQVHDLEPIRRGVIAIPQAPVANTKNLVDAISARGRPQDGGHPGQEGNNIDTNDPHGDREPGEVLLGVGLSCRKCRDHHHPVRVRHEAKQGARQVRDSHKQGELDSQDRIDNVGSWHWPVPLGDARAHFPHGPPGLGLDALNIGDTGGNSGGLLQGVAGCRGIVAFCGADTEGSIELGSNMARHPMEHMSRTKCQKQPYQRRCRGSVLGGNCPDEGRGHIAGLPNLKPT